MLGPWAFESQGVVKEHVLTGPLSRYRHGSLDELGGQVVLLKLCVSNTLAGSIIGRGGHNRDQLQLASGGARIQLSRPNELYPGTSDRVLVLSGTLGACLTALFAISGCLGMPGPLPLEAVFMGVSTQWKLILPSSVCGYILGAGGRTLRSITSQADANVSISAEPERDVDTPRERIATITGSCLHTLRAIGLIVDKLLSRPFVEPGEPPFEGQFPSSRVALLARTGHLRNPPGLVQQLIPPRMLQQQQMQQQQMQQQQMQQQQQQQAAAAPMAPPAGQAIYAQPAAGASTFLYFPLQPGATPVLPLAAASVGMAHPQVALPMGPGPPHGAGAMASALQAMGNIAMPAALAPQPMGPAPASMVAAPMPAAAAAAASQGAARGELAGGGAEPLPHYDVVGPRLEVSIEVPDNRVGLLIGRGGETLHSMQRLMNVSIHIARKPPVGDSSSSTSAAPASTTGTAAAATGTTATAGAAAAASASAPPQPRPGADSMRRVTISGSRNAVNMAHAFILQRLSGGSSASSGVSPGMPSGVRTVRSEGTSRH